MLKSHQGGDLTPAETKVDYLRFAKVLYEERNGFKLFISIDSIANARSQNKTMEASLAPLLRN